MKILKARQIKELDQKTLERQNITSWELMERASTQVVKALRLPSNADDIPRSVFCGKGNNGGDGLAIARMLFEKGFEVTVFLVEGENYSEDNLKNQQLLQSLGLSIQKFTPDVSFSIKEESIVIDALFGNGLYAPLDERWHKVFQRIVDSRPREILAIDTPSGFLPDCPMQENFPCLTANKVFTFEVPKLGMLFPGASRYFKDFTLVKIGLETAVAYSFDSCFYFVEKEDARRTLKSVSKFAHKGNFGHVLVAGGSYGKIGAMVLSSRAALKSGSGLVTAFVPQCGYPVLQATNPEVMCLTDTEAHFVTQFPSLKNYQAIAVGMGLGQKEQTEEALLRLLEENSQSKLVIDADALNLLARQENPFELLPKQAILTPHPKELERLIGAWQDDFEKIERVRMLAQKHQINILIKGAHTATITSDGACYFNSTGNWGMATAGSGDALSGILVSLLGQGYRPKEACILGVFLHGLAGDLAIKQIHPHALVASDLINYIGKAYRQLEEN